MFKILHKTMKNDLKCLAKDNLPIAIALGSGDHQATQVKSPKKIQLVEILR